MGSVRGENLDPASGTFLFICVAVGMNGAHARFITRTARFAKVYTYQLVTSL